MALLGNEFTQFEHEGWERVAGKYDSIWAQSTQQFIPHLLEAAAVAQGMSVLDVGAGPGYVAAAAKERGTTTFHPMGTCRMGPQSDSTAVVDDELRVHGIGRLRVIDASIFPRITSGNTNAPTYVIAEKGARAILNSVQSAPI